MKTYLKLNTIVICLFFLFGCTTQNKIIEGVPSSKKVIDKNKALEYYFKGNEAEEKHNYTEAIENYSIALKYDDADAIYFSLAKNYFRIEKFEDGVKNANEAVKRDSLNLEYLNLLAEGYVILQENDSALKIFNSILKIDSHDYIAQYSIAYLIEKKNPLKALNIYENILHRSPNPVEVLSKIAFLNYSLNRVQQTANVYNQILKFQPKNNFIKTELGNLYFNLNKIDSAFIIFTELYNENKKDILFNGMLAEIYLTKKNWENAKSHLNVILNSDSLNYETRWRVATIFFGQSAIDGTLIDETISQLKICSNISASDWRPKFFLGIAYSEKNNLDFATAYFDSVTKVASWNLEAWSNLAYLYFQKKEYNQIIKILSNAVKIFPNESNIFYYLGLAYSQLNNHTDAIKNYDVAKKLNPRNPKIFSSLGFSYDILKDFKNSDSAYEKAISLDSIDATSLNNYAYSLVERNLNLEKALMMSKKSIEVDSLNASFFDTIGWIYFKLGSFNLALENINTALKLESEPNSVMIEHLGDIYFKLNKIEFALENWHKALQIEPNNVTIKNKILESKK